ncbi:hypothetical protein F4821DRAFT_278350 [Hypoxylon rubiginosum]|uniref:Uncharacterized protein n=1 Tax=Hypoxylon rubiginosum TaxID=110542 RepID=A0ACC0D2M5_9PEZI|nr:hypothetical protein F4821DRAFT_278350 [Hypoxylon rubiginosum]
MSEKPTSKKGDRPRAGTTEFDTDVDAESRHRSKSHLNKRSKRRRASSYSDDENSDYDRHRSSRKRREPKRPKRYSPSPSRSPSPSPSPSSSDKRGKGSKKGRQGRKAEEDEEFQSRMRGPVRDEEKRIAKAMSSARDYVKEQFPAVTKERFDELVPRYPDGFTPKEVKEAEKKWKEDPIRPYLMGTHRRGPRDAFITVYRMLLRYYDCLYEDFMGPRFQLRYDNRDNDRVVLGDDSDDAQEVLHDPFPTRTFSYALHCLLSHHLWLGNLQRLATCLQFVNIVRTEDTRPWSIVDCDPESRFFRTWQRVVADNSGSKKSARKLFREVKDKIGSPGQWSLLFDQIVKSVQVKRQSQKNQSSQRKSDEDPYFIDLVDLQTLIHALDSVSNFGIPLFHGALFTEAAVKCSKPDQSYPSQKEFEAARDREIVYFRLMRSKDAAEDVLVKSASSSPRSGSRDRPRSPSRGDGSDEDSDDSFGKGGGGTGKGRGGTGKGRGGSGKGRGGSGKGRGGSGKGRGGSSRVRDAQEDDLLVSDQSDSNLLGKEMDMDEDEIGQDDSPDDDAVRIGKQLSQHSTRDDDQHDDGDGGVELGKTKSLLTRADDSQQSKTSFQSGLGSTSTGHSSNPFNARDARAEFTLPPSRKEYKSGGSQSATEGPSLNRSVTQQATESAERKLTEVKRNEGKKVPYVL